MMLIFLLGIYLLGVIANLVLGYLTVKPKTKTVRIEILKGSLVSWFLTIKLIDTIHKIKYKV